MSRLVVVGDALLDTDVEGTVDRLCPDAPAPVLAEQRVRQRPGGAGLAASLLAADGHDVVLACAVADDPGGSALLRLLAQRGVRLVPLPESGSTREKRRLRAQGTSIARWDSGTAGEVRVDETTDDALRDALASADAVLASDYGGPVLRHAAVRRALGAALATGRPVVWDPHPRGGSPVPGATAVTPNEAEARSAAGGADPPGLPGAARAADRLVRMWQVGAVVVTRGAGGALSSVGDGAPLVVPAPYAATGDPCGAGDRFATSLTAALGGGAVLSEAVAAAVAAATAFVSAGGAAGIVVGEAGSADERGHRPGDEAGAGAVTGAAAAAAAATAATATAADVVTAVRARGGTVVATGGCFDLLHAGHVACLQRAATLGDCLVVALNSDASVRRLKGDGRPLQTAADRAAVLLALGCVDAVAVFEEDTPVALLERLRPDVWVKGGDYAATQLPEADALARWGGQVVVLPYLTGRSTTGLVAALAGAGRMPDTVDTPDSPDTPDDRRST